MDGNADVTLMAANEDVEALAVGDTIWDDGSHLWYRVTGDGEVEVKGEDPNWDNKVANAVIPESFVKDGVTYCVTGIGANAFGKYGALKTISIPASVKRIGDRAFALSALSSVTIAEGVTEIGNGAFDSCFLNSITIPKSVRRIGEMAFVHNENLKSVTIPEGVARIEKRTFDYCISLTKVEIPESVTSIGEGAFCDCSRLTSVTIPAGVTEIGELAFAGSGLTSVEIPQGVTKIKTAVFESCKNLTRVMIPEGVTYIGRNAFFRCESLTAIEIPQNVTGIGEAAFYNCKKLTRVEIPQGVTRIQKYTFSSCTSLSNVEVPGNVTSIGDQAFEDCDSLASVTISEKVSKIGMEAFKNCDQLKALNIVVSSDENIQFPQAGRNAFVPFPDNNKVNKRYVHFFGTYDTSKDELRGQAYTDAFTEAAQNDGDSDNGKWYGWSYEGVTIDTYTVTINVQKDETPWDAHNRAFALQKDSAAAFTTDLDAVEPGVYTIYDVTGFTDGEFQTEGVNTGVPVNVMDADVSATVDYYTASFYDIDADGKEVVYGNDTDQKPQTILKTVGRVTRPVTDPAKAGHDFEKWVTAPNGDDEFNFASAEITAPTKIYAKWKVHTVPTYTVTINVKKDGTPWSGHDRTFALLDSGGSAFLEVLGQMGDSTYSLSQVPDGTYCIYDITGVSVDSLYSRARDTGAEVRVKGVNTDVTVPVVDADVSATVNYYTATFYDGAEAYKAGTPQEPKIILKGRQVNKPTDDPTKENYDFAGWKTTDGGAVPYDFGTPVTDIASIFASWVEKTAEKLHIMATATEGGTIAPAGDIAVTKGGEQTFTITPGEGYKIKTVTVDGKDVTAELKDTLARAQEGARYYTFTNVTENHTIHAAFEKDGNIPGGGDNPDPGGDNPGGGGDNPDPGGDKPGGGGDKPGGGNGSSGGGHSSSGSDNGTAPSSGTGSGEGTEQMAEVPQTPAPQAPGGQDEGVDDHNVSDAGQTADGKSASADGREPKTGDAAQVEIYATVAMIAGLTYLLLYFVEERRGMTEREKEVFVAAFIRWAKKGGRFRKCCAIAAIFCLLVYYHSIGKRAGRAGFDRECLRQAL